MPKQRQIRAYRGCNIHPCEGTHKLPWSAYAAGRWVSADTLVGIKHLIREALN